MTDLDKDWIADIQDELMYLLSISKLLSSYGGHSIETIFVMKLIYHLKHALETSYDLKWPHKDEENLPSNRDPMTLVKDRN